MRANILGPFVLCRGGLYRGTGRLRYHVLRITPRANHGSFHTKASLEVGEVLGTNSTNRGSSQTIKGLPRKCFTVTSSRPAVTKYRHIIDQLSKLLRTSIVDATQSKNPAVVILATPTFASWLENEAFMQKVLETIFSTKVAAQEGPNLDVTALVAVVDGLPSEKYEEAGHVTEGFAFLPCDHQIALPELWEHNDKDATEYQSNSPRSSITFRILPSSTIEGGLDIGVPLANTMFRNGRTSTLFASKWNRTDSTDVLKRTQLVEKKSAMIYPAASNSIGPLHLEIPLVPLTPLRQVVSGLGNILRQVTNAEGNAVSASQELEASVDMYLEMRSLDKQTVTVWALVVPDSILTDSISEDVSAADLKQIRTLWTDKLDSSINSYVGHWLQQGRGATLHRVLSGGGGWGLKQGLLSLDPETTLLNSADISHSFDLNDSLEDNQIQALGNIAKPGSWVQFLISHNITPNRPTDTIDVGTAVSGFESASNLSFGCIASTVDHIPQPLSDTSAPSDDKDIQPFVNGYHGQFGSMSEAGIFIRIFQNGVMTSSKIDVPNSKVRLAMEDLEEP